MDYQVGARNVRRKAPDTNAKAIESISGMKTVTGLSMGRKRSCVVSVKSGKLRISLSETVAIETDWGHGAEHVHTRLTASHIG